LSRLNVARDIQLPFAKMTNVLPHNLQNLLDNLGMTATTNIIAGRSALEADMNEIRPSRTQGLEGEETDFHPA